MPCDYCTGSHYLSDMPDMGPCVCCTPEALQRAEATLAKRERTIDAMSAPKSLPELLDELEGIASDVRTAHADLTRERDEALATLADAKGALSAHFVEQGQEANPVVTPTGALGELCRLLDLCA
jgi:hypothetical protein